jgi:hypothetical protein
MITDQSGDALARMGAMDYMADRDRERRRYPRFEISFPISFKVFGMRPADSESAGIKGIGIRTSGQVGNVSLEGLFVEANPTHDQLGEIIRAKQERDRFGIQIETSMMGENIKMTGKVVWYDINFLEEAPYHFRAGIFLEEMDRATKEVWERLISKVKN